MFSYQIKSGMVLDILNQVESTLDNPNPMLADMGEFLTSSSQDRFRTSTAPDGSKWQANSQNTYLSLLGNKHSDDDGKLNAKGINRVASKKPLVQSNNLMNSIHYQISGNLLLVGSNLIYAATHQFGATIKAKNAKSLSWKVGDQSIFVKQVVIPAREYLGISLADETELYAIAEDHLLS
ncbi:phage virion morphogenesis protein [Acinetobacter sp. WCHAc060033]|jgi:phage virion morphogenesis protein|uniref:phage virion morphogenesis protein n=1 Tax=Acinetobacter sp. WCHAc060033 TaxID=2518624 RepID=UPI0010237171|nr:phage virion morphogenesis protein [Acinetobacter sp. WCHAc060033]RZG81819.1 phage virion morphogenesis protein [Acinetobacter sp. WCHAc060033]